MKFLTFALIALLPLTSIGQGFMPGFDRFSSKKTAYVTLTDGTKLEGMIEDLDRKKGNIEEVKLRVKKKIKLQPEDIQNMYLPASGLNKFASNMDAVLVVDKWDNKDLNLETIEKGYGYFESIPVLLKKKEQNLLMQLINPHFSQRIRVYFDPYARQTMAIGMAGLTVAGGLDKSYFVKVGDAPAYKIEKKYYDEQYPVLFKSCPTLLSKIDADPDWKDLAVHIFEFTNCDKKN